jgi:hypothetical protein
MADRFAEIAGTPYSFARWAMKYDVSRILAGLIRDHRRGAQVIWVVKVGRRRIALDGTIHAG